MGLFRVILASLDEKSERKLLIHRYGTHNMIHTCKGCLPPSRSRALGEPDPAGIYTNVQLQGGLWTQISRGNVIGCEHALCCRRLFSENSAREPSLLETVSVVRLGQEGRAGRGWVLQVWTCRNSFRAGWVHQQDNSNNLMIISLWHHKSLNNEVTGCLLKDFSD